jgi:hypothetical protein
MISALAMMMMLNGKQLKKPAPVVPVARTWPFKPDANAKSSA